MFYYVSISNDTLTTLITAPATKWHYLKLDSTMMKVEQQITAVHWSLAYRSNMDCLLVFLWILYDYLIPVRCVIPELFSHSGNLKLSGKQISSVTSENPKISKNFTALLKTYIQPMGPSKGPMTWPQRPKKWRSWGPKRSNLTSAALVFGCQILPLWASGPLFFWPLRSGHGSLRWTHWLDIGFEECSPWFLKLSAVLVFGGQIWPPRASGPPFFWPLRSGHGSLRWTHWSDIGFEECSPWFSVAKATLESQMSVMASVRP